MQPANGPVASEAPGNSDRSPGDGTGEQHEPEASSSGTDAGPVASGDTPKVPEPASPEGRSHAPPTPASREILPATGKRAPPHGDRASATEQRSNTPIPSDLLDAPHATGPRPPGDARAPSRATAPPSERPGALPGNPIRPNVVLRALFSNVGLAGGDAPGGRMGGLRLDAGLSWNAFGAGLAVAVFGGRVARRAGQRIPAFLAGGPALSLGRLAMVGRGVLDLRLAYLFGWAPLLEDGAPLRSAAPHGPAVTFDMALAARAKGSSRHIHAFGVSLSYQAFVHDLRGRLPVAHVLGAGLVYWFD